ncbi:unnamed protein product [Orchesella dallaii]|uniref:Uncharacterized protein n=1 Tax=Orchesella dallaii TaxID=48710 RepID=A0ABP1R0C5_9HEXA
MDRGDMRPVVYESFKDLKARRAEQEAYRRALDEQIMQKKLMQQQEREKFEGKKVVLGGDTSRNNMKFQNLTSSERTSSSHSATTNFNNPATVKVPLRTTGFCNTQFRPRSNSGAPPRINDIDNFNEPHPAAVVASMEGFQNPITKPVGQFQPYAVPNNVSVYYNPQQANIPILSTPNDRVPQALPALWLPPPQIPSDKKTMGPPCDRAIPETIVGVVAPQQFKHSQNVTADANPKNLFEESHVQRPRSVRNSLPPTPVPDIPPECMKYIQQVLPGFSVPMPKPQSRNGSVQNHQSTTQEESKSEGQSVENSENQAFSSCTSSESSSVENVLIEASKKVHVSQTSEQLAGVRVTRKQYKSELQKQIDERKRREEELRRKDQEEEERIQRKIRIDQEKMQREYEEDLRKQQEKELEEERKRQDTVSKQSEFIKADEKLKARNKGKGKKQTCVQRDANHEERQERDITAEPATSSESLESIGDFFDTTMKLDESHINPDDRIIPVVAKRLMKEKIGETYMEPVPTEVSEQYDTTTLCSNDNRKAYNASSGSPTARIRGGCTMSESFSLPEPPLPR